MQEIMCNMQDCEPVTGDCRGDIVFILDSSHSIGSQNWFVVKQFVMDVIHGLKISADQTRVGVVSFATMTVNNFHLQEYYDVDEMAEKIWEMAYLAGSTNTADGIMFMRQMMAMHRRPDVQQIAILLTDGVSNVDAGRTIPEADAAKDEDIEIFVVAVGDADQDEVRRIASDPRWLFNVTDFTALNSLTMDIIEETCSASELVNCGPCEFSSCSESCGADGTQTGEKECKRFERFTSQLVETFIVDCADQNCFVPCPTTTTPTTTTETTTTPTTTTETTTTPTTTTETTTTPTTTTETTTTPTTTTETTTPSTTTTPVPVDCHKCDFTKGQIWRPDPENCHRFYICEPLVDANSDGISDVGEYRIHHMTCDELYWDQDLHTCVEEMPANAQCDQTAPPVPFTGTTPAPIDCPYEPKANDPQFFSGANDTDYQKCSDGMIFVSGLVCTCVENPRGITCIAILSHWALA
ncbi:hypothetical protein NP493_1548g00037 [Ridgeia piscesae]|uniref:VWFA domain-containing protein n=1 Tax=Ridgeia piscesae TaxID=27915 RepID=A0AAD9K0T4_RIDPI|nr:hypothetical protein NP493_1548g00037 [Ridgeia piscesae]